MKPTQHNTQKFVSSSSVKRYPNRMKQIFNAVPSQIFFLHTTFGNQSRKGHNYFEIWTEGEHKNCISKFYLEM